MKKFIKKPVFFLPVIFLILILTALQFTPPEIIYKVFVRPAQAGSISELEGVTGQVGVEDIYFGTGQATDTFSVATYDGGTVTLTKVPSLFANAASIIKGKWYVAAMSGDHGNTALTGSLAWVIDTLSTDPATIELPGNQTYALTTNLSIPETIVLDFQRGAVLGGTADISGDGLKHIQAGAWQIFSTTGTITFPAGSDLKSSWFADFETAITKIGAAGVSLEVTEADTISSDTTVDANTALKWVCPGRILTISPGKTLTINGSFEAGRYQVVIGAIAFITAQTVFPEWWGPNTTPGTTDMSAEIQAAVDTNANITVSLGGYAYYIGTGITAQEHTWFVGIGSTQPDGGSEIVTDAAIDMISYPASSWYFGITNILFDGGGVATSGITVAGSATYAGIGSLRDIYVKNCVKGIFFDNVYHTDIKAHIINCTTTGVELIGDSQHNDLYLWTNNCTTHILIDNGKFNKVFTNSAQMTGASTTLVRIVRITNDSDFNEISGSIETEYTPTSGDVVSIDDNSSYNVLHGISFATSGAAAQDFDVVQIGVKGVDAQASKYDTVRECLFAGQDAGYYDVQIEYGDGTTILKSEDSSATNNLVTTDESDTYYALYTKHIPGHSKANKISVSTDRTIKPSESDPFWFAVDTSGGNVIMTPPRATADLGSIIRIVKTDAANYVDITRLSGNFYPGPGGSQHLYLTGLYDYAEFISDGTNYIITGMRKTQTVVWDPANLVDGAGETKSITVTGAAFGDFVQVSAPYDLQDMTVIGYVQAAGTVEIRLQNASGGAIDLASGTWKVSISR